MLVKNDEHSARGVSIGYLRKCRLYSEFLKPPPGGGFLVKFAEKGDPLLPSHFISSQAAPAAERQTLEAMSRRAA